MDRRNELSPETQKILERIVIVVVSVVACAIIMIIFLGIAAWYKALF